MLQKLTNVNIPTPPPPHPRSYVACGCVASSHERQHPHPTPPHPTPPKKLRSMWMCCKFSRTSTSPPHPTPPKKLRSMRMCCKFSRTSTSPPHPTPPKKLRSMRMCCKFSRTSTSPPHPTQPKKLRFTKTLKTLARCSPRWQIQDGDPWWCPGRTLAVYSPNRNIARCSSLNSQLHPGQCAKVCLWGCGGLKTSLFSFGWSTCHERFLETWNPWGSWCLVPLPTRVRCHSWCRNLIRQK